MLPTIPINKACCHQAISHRSPSSRHGVSWGDSEWRKTGYWSWVQFSSVQSLNRVWLFVTPWTTARQASLSITNPPSLPTHVHWVGDAIQSSHPLSSFSPLTFNLSQHQSLFKWVSSLHQVAKGLEFQLQHQSFQLIFRANFLYDALVGSPCSPRDTVFSNTTVQKHQFFSAQLSL